MFPTSTKTLHFALVLNSHLNPFSSCPCPNILARLPAILFSNTFFCYTLTCFVFLAGCRYDGSRQQGIICPHVHRIHQLQCVMSARSPLTGNTIGIIRSIRFHNQLWSARNMLVFFSFLEIPLCQRPAFGLASVMWPLCNAMSHCDTLNHNLRSIM